MNSSIVIINCFLYFILCFFFFLNHNHKVVVGLEAAENDFSSLSVDALTEKKNLCTPVLTELKLRLNNLEKVNSLKQSEINGIELVKDSLTGAVEKLRADFQIKKLQHQLTSLTPLIEELQLKVKTSSLMLKKIDETISEKLDGKNPTLIKFAIQGSGSRDGLLVVKENSTIFGIGYNAYGNLGCGFVKDPVTAPCKVIDTGVLKGKTISQIKSHGVAHNIILTTDNTLISFGNNQNGALGNLFQTANVHTPILVDNSLFIDKQIKQLEVGYGGAMILTTDGNVYGWSSNQYGELCMTVNGAGFKSTPTLITPFSNNDSGNNKKIKKVFYQMYTSAFLMEDGDVYICGQNPANPSLNYNAPTKLDVSSLDPSDIIEDISIGDSILIIRTRSGNLYSMGKHSNNDGAIGALGSGDTVNRELPTLITYFPLANIKITKVCVGNRHVIALSQEGKIYQWGTIIPYAANSVQTTGSPTPFRFIGNEIENYKIVDIYCGSATNVAVSDSGVVFGWGLSYFFGLGTTNNAISVPTKLTLP